MKRIILSACVFLYITAGAAFAFWIGGGEPFTLGAGMIAGITLIAATMAAIICYVESRP